MAMLMWHLTVVWFFAAILSKYQAQASTRWQPSIIWDRFNPLLTCQCNWMNIPKFAIYDRVELLCAKTYLVSSFRTKDMAKREVYYNIFMRKYKGNSSDELRQQLESGDFCDKDHNDTKRLYTCERDDTSVSPPKLYESYKVRFHSDEDLYDGDVVVFFSNKATGLKEHLESPDKKCAMVLVVNVDNEDKQIYDPSFGKSFTPDTTTTAPTATRAPTTAGAPNITISPNTTIASTTTAAVSNTTSNSTTNTGFGPPTIGGRTGDDCKKIKKLYFIIGLAVGIIIMITINLVIYVIVVKTKGKPIFVKKSEEMTARMEKTKSEGRNFEPVITISKDSSDKSNDSNHSTDQNENKSDQNLSQDIGFPNQGFQPSTPTAPPQEEPEYVNNVMPNQTRSCNGRLPSVDGGARVLPPLKFKHQTRPSSFEKKEKQGKNQQNGYNAART